MHFFSAESWQSVWIKSQKQKFLLEDTCFDLNKLYCTFHWSNVKIQNYEFHPQRAKQYLKNGWLFHNCFLPFCLARRPRAHEKALGNIFGHGIGSGHHFLFQRTWKSPSSYVHKFRVLNESILTLKETRVLKFGPSACCRKGLSLWLFFHWLLRNLKTNIIVNLIFDFLYHCF